MTAAVTATIDLSALRHNLNQVRRLVGHRKILAMVKADGYGHGLGRAATAMADADGFGVARLDEALALRAAGVRKRIVLLGTLLSPATVARCAREKIDLVAHDPESVRCIAQTPTDEPVTVWLKLDSGMHRLGLSPEQFPGAHKTLAAAAHVGELVHMTHFSDAERLDQDITAQQLRRFSELHASHHCATSLANSAAIIAHPDSHGDWVRPGIMLYGTNPVPESHPVELRQVMTLTAPVLAIRHVEAGDAVGYNQLWRAPRASTVATIGIGYGDGYPRHAPNGTPVWINGQQAPLAGRVSMDVLSVDITDANSVSVGDRVQLWGPQLPADIVADCAGTISYQLFTSITSRVHREYRE